MNAKEFRELRRSAGLTQVALADLLDVTQGWVTHKELGRSRITKRDEIALRAVLSGKVRAKAVARSSSKSLSIK